MFELPPKNSPSAARNFSLYPLAWLAACFASGIFIGNRLELHWGIYLALCLSPPAGLALALIRRKFSTLILLVSFIALGAFCLRVERQSIAPDRLKTLYDGGELISGEPVEITGVLQGKPELTVGGFFLVLKAEKLTYKKIERKVSGKIRLFAPVTSEAVAGDYERLRLAYGTEVRIGCALRREEKFLNPGAVSAAEILDRQQLDATATIKSPLLVENLGERSETFAPLRWAFDRRQDLILDFKKYFSVSTSGVLIASLLGNRYHLDKPSAERFREGGTFHVVVISGLQITFIGGLMILLMRRLTKNRWAQFLAASVFLWLYTLLVGADTPVTRAALMFTVLHFANVIFRQATLLNALGAAAFLLLAWRPSDFFDQSFQLTFACVGAIVATAFPLLERLRSIGEWRPSAETPVPPDCSKKLKIFCETLYWSEADWQREQSRSTWQANLFKSPYAERLERRRLQKILRFVFEMLTVSAIVQAWLIPFLVVYFHRISLIGIFLNIWVGILIAIESLVAMAAVIVAQASETTALPLVKITEILNWLLLHFADWFIENGWASLRLPHYAGAGKAIYVLYFLPVVTFTILIHQWKPFVLKARNGKRESLKIKRRISKAAFAAYGILLGIIIFHPFSEPAADGRLRVEFLDVGQGDAALITLPTGETILVDGGGKPKFNTLYVIRENGEEPELFEPDTQNIGEAVVSNFLWAKGYDRVDYILATHADADHIQGLADVARNFRVRAALFGRTPFDDADFAELYRVLQKRNIPLKKLERGETLIFGKAKIEILHPPREESRQPEDSANNQSIVLRLIYGDRKILLTGDIEREAENELLNSPEFLRADAVKVAHHGSKTSSAQPFVDATQAKLAVISVGRESPFGHPKPEIVKRWKQAGARVLTTGENGAVSLSTDGRDLQLKTFRGKTIFR